MPDRTTIPSPRGRTRDGVSRASIAAVAALTAVAVSAAPAFAHGGTLLARTERGPYVAGLYAAATSLGGSRPAVDLSVYLHQRDTGYPAGDARVRLSVTRPGQETRTFSTERLGNAYHATVPRRSAHGFRRWTVTAHIRGPSTDPVSITYTPPKNPGRLGSLTMWILVGTIAAEVAAVIAVTVYIRRRKSRAR